MVPRLGNDSKPANLKSTFGPRNKHGRASLGFRENMGLAIAGPAKLLAVLVEKRQRDYDDSSCTGKDAKGAHVPALRHPVRDAVSEGKPDNVAESRYVDQDGTGRRNVRSKNIGISWPQISERLGQGYLPSQSRKAFYCRDRGNDVDGDKGKQDHDVGSLDCHPMHFVDVLSSRPKQDAPEYTDEDWQNEVQEVHLGLPFPSIAGRQAIHNLVREHSANGDDKDIRYEDANDDKADIAQWPVVGRGKEHGCQCQVRSETDTDEDGIGQDQVEDERNCQGAKDGPEG